MDSLARLFIILGIILLVVGGILYLVARTGFLSGLTLGRLPGDIRIQSGGVTCFFPLATMILLSVVLTILLNIIVRFLNK